MSAPVRWVLIDDTDSSIQYSGPWSLDRGTLTNIGNFGPPFQNTLHGVNSDASLSFTFSGTQLIVLGTSQVVQNSDGTTDPSWECSIDGTSIPAKTALLFAENNWIFCEDDSLSNGQHTVTVTATVGSGQTFLFDRFQYNPTQSSAYNNAIVNVDDTDAMVQYGSNWQVLDGIAHMTQTNGAKATVSFIGTQLSWVSTIPGGSIAGAPTTATYSIDGGSPVTFNLVGLASGAMQPYNQVFFQTPKLSPGAHQLEVVHGGNANTTPLSLDYLLIQNSTVAGMNTSPPLGSSAPGGASSGTTPGTASSSATVSGSASASSLASATTTATGSSGIASSNSAGGVQSTQLSSSTVKPSVVASPNAAGSDVSSTRSSNTPIGAIVGGVVGGVVAIAIAILLYLYFSRRAKRKAQYGQYNGNRHDVEPFVSSPPVSISQEYSSIYSPSHTGAVGATIAAMFSSHKPSIPSTSQSPAFNSPGHSSGQETASVSNDSAQSDAPLLTNRRVQNANIPVAGDLLTSTKSREAEGYDHTQSPSIPSSEPLIAPTPPRLVRHEDSGIRIPHQESEVVDLPPLYTPG